MRTIKSICIKFFYALLIFLLVLYLWNPPVILFFILLDMIWLLLLLEYGNGHNSSFLENVLIITSAAAFALVVEKYVKGSSCRQITLAEAAGIGIACVEILVSRFLVIRKQLKDRGEQQDTDGASKIIKARAYDLIRVKEYIQKHQIVGVNGAWGSGKSYLVERLYEDTEFQQQFEVIQVDLLAVHLKEIEKILLRSMDDILRRYAIFSSISGKLQGILGNYKFFMAIQSLFFRDTKIVSSVFRYYQKDINKKMPEGKTILIVYDDIDRIGDKETIMRVFALSEKLASDRVHILYQFGYEYLEQKELCRGELEKFIPHVVTLTDISFGDIVKHLWEECQMEHTGLKLNELRFLPRRTIRNNQVDRLCGKKMELSVHLGGITIRGVKIFLEELETMISENPYYRKKENQEILIPALFIKNFMYEYFERVQMGEELTDTLLFQVDGEEKTIQELLHDMGSANGAPSAGSVFAAGAFEQVMQEQENRMAYYILNILEYDFFAEEIQGNREERANMEVNRLTRLQKNERINHILWNIMGNGYSEYSDMEQAVRTLCEDVLTEDKSKWKEHWDELGQKSYVSDLYKNNRGIIIFGMDPYILFFQGMRVSLHVTQAQWRRWITFYFDQAAAGGITVEMLECLNYCDFTKGKDFYIDTIQRFCECRVKGNFAGNPVFLRFLHRLISPIGYLGYSHRYCFEGWRFDFHDWSEGLSDLLKQQLQDCIRALEEERENTLFAQIREELPVVKEFLLKCLEIMDASPTLKAREMQITVSDPKTVYRNQEQLDQLLCILDGLGEDDEKGGEEFIAVCDQWYRDGRLEPSECQVLQRRYHEKYKKK